jgi:ribosome-binding protein aMBF1 (putative translation factor)
MRGHTKKHPTESDRLEARFVGSRDKIAELRKVAERLGLKEVDETLTIAEAFPEYGVNPLGAALRGARRREGLTQRQLAEATGIPQRHISEMESGRRSIGKERARKLAEALQVSDYRVFL